MRGWTPQEVIFMTCCIIQQWKYKLSLYCEVMCYALQYNIYSAVMSSARAPFFWNPICEDCFLNVKRRFRSSDPCIRAMPAPRSIFRSDSGAFLLIFIYIFFCSCTYILFVVCMMKHCLTSKGLCEWFVCFAHFVYSVSFLCCLLLHTQTPALSSSLCTKRSRAVHKPWLAALSKGIYLFIGAATSFWCSLIYANEWSLADYFYYYIFLLFTISYNLHWLECLTFLLFLRFNRACRMHGLSDPCGLSW